MRFGRRVWDIPHMVCFTRLGCYLTSRSSGLRRLRWLRPLSSAVRLPYGKTMRRAVILVSITCVSGCATLSPKLQTTLESRRVTYAMAGEGSVTVVFESGLGDGMEIYPTAPRTAGLKARIEEYLNDYGLQVVWYYD